MPAGQNLEIMTFRYLKTLVFDKFLKKLQWLIFLFLKSIVSDNYSLFMIIWLCPLPSPWYTLILPLILGKLTLPQGSEKTGLFAEKINL